jgi:hypothetical protein
MRCTFEEAQLTLVLQRATQHNNTTYTYTPPLTATAQRFPVNELDDLLCEPIVAAMARHHNRGVELVTTDAICIKVATADRDVVRK